jgi:hypothetical protein
MKTIYRTLILLILTSVVVLISCTSAGTEPILDDILSTIETQKPVPIPEDILPTVGTKKPVPIPEDILPTVGIKKPVPIPEDILPTVGIEKPVPFPKDILPGVETHVFVDEILINLMESFPVQVSMTVLGNLSDGCVQLNQLTPVYNSGNWLIRIDAERDPELICASVLVPFEESVSLDVEGFAAGTYTVTAGDKTATFTLDMDNEI